MRAGITIEWSAREMALATILVRLPYLSRLVALWYEPVIPNPMRRWRRGRAGQGMGLIALFRSDILQLGGDPDTHPNGILSDD